jgi:Ca2+-binding RTX toxin-like protein
MSGSVVPGARYSAIVLAVLLLAAAAHAATWNVITGTRHADRIRGTTASDRLRGLEGNDVIRGRAADDRLAGGPGDDMLIGGPGQDSYICGGGEDVVVIGPSRVAGQMERFGDGCEAAILDVSSPSPR